ncbi:hypothetical protein [Paraburkholderia acidisoli]|uniref:Uncharacterized protein n=1 Tax=Paraburkholderia acidisoli TaxID=2571748 RepID=A0A7Z2GJ00_9BURK|nr:hypothetical protein [Paraburkholderia acidisoli]QGZ62593.1 hypothetical protein FAZ98_13140 [Paraburkholderia acidisoli]
MNNRHIQTFLTVSAAFFAMSAPLHSNARTPSGANAVTPCVRSLTDVSGTSAKAETNVLPSAKAEQK